MSVLTSACYESYFGYALMVSYTVGVAVCVRHLECMNLCRSLLGALNAINEFADR